MSHWISALLTHVAHMGWWGIALFVGLYVIVALLMAPAFLLTVTAGALYGVTRGSLLVFISASVGASVAFGFARRLSETRLMRRLDRDPRVVVIRDAIGANSLWVQFLLRLSPIIPFTALNYVLGLARVRFKDFVLALVGMIPAIVMYTYYGRVVGDVAALVAGAAPKRGREYYVLLGVGVVTTVLASMIITRAARRALGTSSTGMSDVSSNPPSTLR